MFIWTNNYWKFILGQAWAGPRLGNFNYDIGRSVQTYNLPIYGMEQGGTYTIQINEQAPEKIYGGKLELMNVTAHSGHGYAAAEDCDNGGSFIYEQNPSHQGELEYANFGICQTRCYPDKPNDYCFNVPSSWNSYIV